VLEHIANDRGALDALRERLRPGGHLLLLVPSHQFLYSPIDRGFDHERRYARHALRALLEEAGFGVPSSAASTPSVRSAGSSQAASCVVPRSPGARCTCSTGSCRCYACSTGWSCP